MPTLFLLRHAKSDWSDHGSADIDRPLSPRGERAAVLMAHAMAERRLIPDLVLCSPARRTRETLAALQPVLGDAVPVRIADELYEPATGDYRSIVEEGSADAEKLMIIGHNPAIQATAMLLVGKGDAGLLPRARREIPDRRPRRHRFQERGLARTAATKRPAEGVRSAERPRGQDRRGRRRLGAPSASGARTPTWSGARRRRLPLAVVDDYRRNPPGPEQFRRARRRHGDSVASPRRHRARQGREDGVHLGARSQPHPRRTPARSSRPMRAAA